MYSFFVALMASHPHGHNLPAEVFVEPLEIAPHEEIDSTLSGAGKWACSRVVFPIVRLADSSEAAEPHEHMMGRLATVFENVALFLSNRSRELFDRFRSEGLQVSLFIDVWIDQDQMEFHLPPSLLWQAGRLGLGIHLISNDL